MIMFVQIGDMIINLYQITDIELTCGKLGDTYVVVWFGEHSQVFYGDDADKFREFINMKLPGLYVA